MKKRIMAIALCLCLLAVAAMGTIAYFTDADGAVNVMTTGNVKIVQNEQERGENGLVAFADNHKLAPYTGSVGANGVANAWGTPATINGKEYKMFDQSKNAIDKIVTVTNNGTEEAYIRTLFAFEIPKDGNNDNDDFLYDRVLNINADRAIEDVATTITYGDVEYFVGYSYYGNDSKLAAGKTSDPSMLQIYLNANADNEWYDQVGAKYEILVLTQATQTQGFDDAETALNTAFGDPTEVDQETLELWFAECVEINIEF